MKIFFTLESAFNPLSGGVQRTTWKLGEYFHKEGMDVFYFSTKCDGHTENIEFGTLVHLPEKGGLVSKQHRMFLVENLKEIDPDIVINQYPYSHDLRQILNRYKSEIGYKLIGCLRNSLFSFKDNLQHKVQQKFQGSWYLKLADSPPGLKMIHAYHYIKHRRDLKKILDEHDYFILLAPPNRQELEYFTGIYRPEKVRAIPNSIPRVYEPKKKEKIVLYVGRLNVSQKRADLLLKVWEQVYDKLTGWKFVIVGDGEYKKILDKEIEKEKLPRVETVGRKDPKSYYQSSSLLLMPSAYEGFPNVLLEAQSHGVVPVLFDSYSAASWVASHGVNAYLIKPFNTNHMADKIVQLASEPERIQKISKASIHNAERFTIDKVGKTWVSFFEEIL